MGKKLIDSDSFEFIEGAQKDEFNTLSEDVSTLQDNMSTAQSNISTLQDNMSKILTPHGELTGFKIVEHLTSVRQIQSFDRDTISNSGTFNVDFQYELDGQVSYFNTYTRISKSKLLIPINVIGYYANTANELSDNNLSNVRKYNYGDFKLEIINSGSESQYHQFVFYASHGQTARDEESIGNYCRFGLMALLLDYDES